MSINCRHIWLRACSLPQLFSGTAALISLFGNRNHAPLTPEPLTGRFLDSGASSILHSIIQIDSDFLILSAMLQNVMSFNVISSEFMFSYQYHLAGKSSPQIA